MPAATLDDLARADRVLCYGVTGSGKSTAATRIGALTGLPVHLVDEEIGWLPGWVARPQDEQIALARGIVAGGRWVLDSAYGSYLGDVLPRTQVVVALDYPRWLSLGRLVRRTITRAVDQQEVCNGNRESWRQALSRDSILVWHARSFARKHERVVAWEAATDGPPVLRLTHPRDLDAALAHLAARRPAAGATTRPNTTRTTQTGA